MGRSRLIAREIAQVIIDNLGRFRFRHKCVIKITSKYLSRIIESKYGHGMPAKVVSSLIGYSRSVDTSS